MKRILLVFVVGVALLLAVSSCSYAPKVNRWLNMVLAAFYIVVMLLTMPGAWLFYILFGVIEIAIGVLTIWYAWSWPKQVRA